MSIYNWSIRDSSLTTKLLTYLCAYQKYFLEKDKIIRELCFKAVRSSGAGGQHVNKVSSKVELSFDLENSKSLSDKERGRLLLKLAPRLTKEHILILQCDEARSQHQNKELVTKRFFEIMEKALQIPKKRKPTKPSKSSIEKRLKSKKADSTKKMNRQKPKLD